MLKHRGEAVADVNLFRQAAPLWTPTDMSASGTSNVYVQNTTPATYTSANVSVA